MDQEDSFPHKINLNSLGCISTTKDLENSYIQDTRTKIIPIKKISRAPIDPGVNLNLEEKIQLPCPNLKQKNPKIYSWRWYKSNWTSFLISSRIHFRVP